MKLTKEESLQYHSSDRKGKIEVVPTKPCLTARDLSMAYTPGVAEPCREIHKNVEEVYKYTAKGNLVAVLSNGTAVLGLGDIGPEAGKPVMEGKGVLFKRFADIDVFDIEVNSHDPKEIIRVTQILEPTFGGINLEDIKAPECFEIEETLKATMNIPVFHDDQHGTAIISCAALINAVEVAGKKLDKIRIVVNGAGASAISCCKHYVRAGVKRENIFMFDSKGCITKGRKDLNKYKEEFAQEKGYDSLEEAFKGADVFIGLSVGNVVQKDWVKTMAPNPIIFAMANPDPEITYDDAMSVRQDLIMATGRSDFPNQVNNVLGFPFIFRGALDVRATQINDEMKLAATLALSKLAKEKVPEMVIRAYGGEEFEFGRDYIIPKPFDPRVLWYVAPAVAKAAIETGVAKITEVDWVKYEEELKERLGLSKEIIRVMIHKSQKYPKKVVYPEGEEENIIRAAHTVAQDGIAKPVLLGNEKFIKKEIERIGYDVNEFQIIDPEDCKKCDVYAEAFFRKRQRRGATLWDAKNLIKKPNYYGAMMVELDEADAMISGYTTSYPNTIRPALQCIGVKEGLKIVSGLYIVIAKKETYFFADCTVNINPDSEQLAEIAISAAETVKAFDVVPKIAMLSFSNFGSAPYPESNKVKEAVKIVKTKMPELIIDGEMQADTAVVPEILEKTFPFTNIKGGANVLIFPDLSSANIAYKLMARIGQATVIGPILMGMKKPVHVLQRGASVDDIYNMTAIAVVEAYQNSLKK
ncbi:MAG: phosphate acetyltransferase [Ignavibacterium sp.]|jgi:malate dehydrogenase (oxaloacetate-decarboxylating)(NADP+)|nr:phosphate acetyltransferase [Ignavibacterium sp.]MDX9712026.1 phosphate acetyltransferase [Ignavibacteriaceae bacterium]GIK23201.1 MAG: bifunctional malic enzyme oxidoreductase/phosphotransacetylase [Ignavibacteriota bacterium]